MAKHVCLGLLALLVLAAAAHVSSAAGIEDFVSSAKKLEASVVAATKAALDGGSSARSDVTACWRGRSLSCALTARCTSSRCNCCGCPCATSLCWFNREKRDHAAVARLAALVRTPARPATAKAFCDLARIQRRIITSMVRLYRRVRCPSYTTYIRHLQGWQGGYDKWCRAFSG